MRKTIGGVLALIMAVSGIRIVEAQIRSQKIALCEEIRFEGSKDHCYFDYAQSRGDVNLCSYINNQAQQKQCVDYLNPEKPEVVIYTLSSDPSAISVGGAESRTFTVSQSGTLEKAVVHVEEIDQSGEVLRVVGVLNDDGEDGDMSENDLVYSGTFTVGPYKLEQVLRYQAVFKFSSNGMKTMITEPYLFHVSNFPIGIQPSDLAKVVDDPQTGDQFISDEVLVGFREGVKSDQIREIIKEINGEVIGVIFGLDIYQIRIADTSDSTGIYQKIKILETYSEVEYAEPNSITSVFKFETR